MAVNPTPKSTVKSAPISIIKNAATAPVVFFDGAPVFGHWSGNVEIVLTARMLGLRSDNTVAADLSAVAQLRCSAQAAAMLRDSLNRALELLSGQGEDAPKH